ncbi:MAG: polysaccharide deacetylase family protein [Eubacteriales bacterium]|nr:polysaccharide deacetylase family protein [Eubacteriales bacterium]
MKRKFGIVLLGSIIMWTLLAIQGNGREAPQIALTFDDGPSSVYTPKLLDGLKERRVKATFFLMGANIEGNEKIVKRMQEEGHLIGNHTYNHVQLEKVSEMDAREEIEKTGNLIYEITGEYPMYLRPPFGSWRKDLELAVTMIPVFWTIDTLDWQNQSVGTILYKVESKIEDGSIILMHDEYEASVEAALEIVDRYKEKGYRFVTVDQFMND